MTVKLIRATNVTLDLHAEDVAALFWRMDVFDQARFFNQLEKLGDARLADQMHFVANSNMLTKNGLTAMRVIGESGKGYPR